MAVSALLSLFDDLSTAALVAKDRSLRPGVSVSLSTEILHAIPAESEVIVVARAEKIGRILGFASVELWDADRQNLLARGRHIKYLPMGWLWDSLLGIGLFVSLFLALYEWWRGRVAGDELDRLLAVLTEEDRHAHSHNNNANELDDHKREKKAGDLSLPQKQKHNEESAQVASLFASLHVTNVALEEYPELSSDRERDGQLCALFQFRVKPFMHNGVGTCHGGAVAVAIEEACVMSRRRLCEQSGRAMKIVSMDVRYLAAMKGELLIKVVDDEHAGVLSTIEGASTKVFRQSIGAVLSKKKLMVCAEFTCCWAWDE